MLRLTIFIGNKNCQNDDFHKTVHAPVNNFYFGNKNCQNDDFHRIVYAPVNNFYWQ